MLHPHDSAQPPKLNVLVVDDNEGMRSLLRLHLTNAGYTVTLANDAIEAGYQILKFVPDIIILDVDLPFINGLELAATLQADATVPHVPIIFITASEDFAPKAESLGADFIVKPFMKARLLESVARNIGLQRDNTSSSLPASPGPAAGVAHA